MTVTALVEEEFPVVDFGSFESNADSVSKEVFQAACRWGFLVLTGHGIPQEDIDEMFALVNISKRLVK
jgi:isopenicillin N synthase-like dioxygenase